MAIFLRTNVKCEHIDIREHILHLISGLNYIHWIFYDGLREHLHRMHRVHFIRVQCSNTLALIYDIMNIYGDTFWFEYFTLITTCTRIPLTIV